MQLENNPIYLTTVQFTSKQFSSSIVFCLQWFCNSLSSFLSCSLSWSLTTKVNSFFPPLLMLHNSFYPLISRGQTSWSGCSVVCPLCDNVTPLTTSSFRSIRCTTFPFFYSPRFFSSPAISITSPTLGVPPLSLLSLWLSIKPHSYSLFQCFHSWALASSNRLVILVSFSV